MTSGMIVSRYFAAEESINSQNRGTKIMNTDSAIKIEEATNIGGSLGGMVRWLVHLWVRQPILRKRRPLPEINHHFAESSGGLRAASELTTNRRIWRNRNHLFQLAAVAKR